jgi:hypothetical protein
LSEKYTSSWSSFIISFFKLLLSLFIIAFEELPKPFVLIIKVTQFTWLSPLIRFIGILLRFSLECDD